MKILFQFRKEIIVDLLISLLHVVRCTLYFIFSVKYTQHAPPKILFMLLLVTVSVIFVHAHTQQTKVKLICNQVGCLFLTEAYTTCVRVKVCRLRTHETLSLYARGGRTGCSASEKVILHLTEREWPSYLLRSVPPTVYVCVRVCTT